jgi:hypothetical protein
VAAKKRPPKSRKAISDNAEMAVILSHAATFGVTAAAKQFGLNRRTIQRYQAEVKAGNNPELSRLIASEKERAHQRNRDKMNRALDALLDRVIELAPTAELTQAIAGVEKIGELSSAMKVMGVKPDLEGEEAPGNEGLGGRVPGGGSTDAVLQ